MMVGFAFELLPSDFRILPDLSFAYPLFLAAFLLVLIVGDPGRIDRQRRWLRTTTGLMIATITGATAFEAVRLVVGILTQASFDGPYPRSLDTGWDYAAGRSVAARVVS